MSLKVNNLLDETKQLDPVYPPTREAILADLEWMLDDIQRLSHIESIEKYEVECEEAKSALRGPETEEDS